MSDRQERELLDFGDEISRYARPAAPAALRSQLRASLLAAPVTHRQQPSIWMRLPAFRSMVAGAVVITILLGSSGYAAASSLPGDPAFALKRAAEETQVALTPDDAARLDTRVTQSDRRIADLHTVAAQRPSAVGIATDEYLAAVARVDEALAPVLGQPVTAARDAAIARAATASIDHVVLLRSLATRLPAEAQGGIQRAIAAQQAVHGRSGDPHGRPSTPPAPGASGAPGGAPIPSGALPGGAAIPSGRPSAVPVSPGRGGPPSGVPGRP